MPARCGLPRAAGPAAHKTGRPFPRPASGAGWRPPARPASSSGPDAACRCAGMSRSPVSDPATPAHSRRPCPEPAQYSVAGPDGRCRPLVGLHPALRSNPAFHIVDRPASAGSVPGRSVRPWLAAACCHRSSGADDRFPLRCDGSAGPCGRADCPAARRSDCPPYRARSSPPCHRPVQQHRPPRYARKAYRWCLAQSHVGQGETDAGQQPQQFPAAGRQSGLVEIIEIVVTSWLSPL